jgi:DNA end-binding protein Ku
MARAIWQGEVVFGRVHVPVRLEGVVQDKSIHTHLVHREDHGRLHMRRFCEKCGNEIEWKDAARAVEVGNREVVDFEPEELKQLKIERDNEVALSGFTDPENVDPVYYDRTYTLVPVGKQPRAFELLVALLRQTGKIAVTRANLSGRSFPAILRVRGADLVLHTLHFGDEVRAARQRPDPQLRPGSREMTLAEQLVEKMNIDFDPTSTEDPYRRAVEEVATGRKPRPIDEAAARRKEMEQDAELLDLTSALQRSLKEGGKEGKKVVQRAARTAGRRGPGVTSARKSAASKHAPHAPHAPKRRAAAG